MCLRTARSLASMPCLALAGLPRLGSQLQLHALPGKRSVCASAAHIEVTFFASFHGWLAPPGLMRSHESKP